MIILDFLDYSFPYKIRSLSRIAKQGKVPDGLKEKYVQFLDDFFADHEPVAEEWKERYKDLKAEQDDKVGSRTTPVEYIQMIYILTYKLYETKRWQMKDTAAFFGFKEHYRDRWGIAPVADYQARNIKYECRSLICSEAEDEMEKLLRFIGRCMCSVVNSYFIGITPNLDILANVPNLNKVTVKNSNVRTMQYYICVNKRTANTAKAFLTWCYADYVRKDSDKINLRIKNIIADISLRDEELLRLYFDDSDLILTDDDVKSRDAAYANSLLDEYAVRMYNLQAYAPDSEDAEKQRMEAEKESIFRRLSEDVYIDRLEANRERLLQAWCRANSNSLLQVGMDGDDYLDKIAEAFLLMYFSRHKKDNSYQKLMENLPGSQRKLAKKFRDIPVGLILDGMVMMKPDSETGEQRSKPLQEILNGVADIIMQGEGKEVDNRNRNGTADKATSKESSTKKASKGEVRVDKTALVYIDCDACDIDSLPLDHDGLYTILASRQDMETDGYSCKDKIGGLRLYTNFEVD